MHHGDLEEFEVELLLAVQPREQTCAQPLSHGSVLLTTPSGSFSMALKKCNQYVLIYATPNICGISIWICRVLLEIIPIKIALVYCVVRKS